MTILGSPPALPDHDYTVDELSSALRRSNHDTAFAGWAVCTMAVGLALQLPAFLSVGDGLRLVLAALLAPLAVAGVHIVRLLERAALAIGVPATASQLLAGLETRRMWTVKAAAWTYGTGAAFLVWSALLQVVAR